MKNSTFTTLKTEFQDVFDGLGKAKILHHANVNKTHPVIMPTRRVPHAILKPFKKKLDRRKQWV